MADVDRIRIRTQNLNDNLQLGRTAGRGSSHQAGALQRLSAYSPGAVAALDLEVAARVVKN
jgi:hypothetical protein